MKKNRRYHFICLHNLYFSIHRIYLNTTEQKETRKIARTFSHLLSAN